MELPVWVAKYKIKGTEVRLIKGRYYLYSITSKWNKEKKRSQKITGPFLGTITEDQGLIPPKVRVSQQVAQSPTGEVVPLIDMQDITVKSYGGAALLLNLSESFSHELAEFFPATHKTLIALAILRVLYQAPLKNMGTLYEYSYVSEMLPDCALSGASLSSFLPLIGSKREKIVSFMQRCSEGAEHVLIDMTHMLSNSEKMAMNAPDYNSAMDYGEQINLLYMYSPDKAFPTYYRLLPESIDVSSFLFSIKEAGVKTALIIFDKDFFSKTTIEGLEKNELHYLCPLRRNHLLSQSSTSSQQYDRYFLFSKRAIWYTEKTIEEYNEQTQTMSKRRIISCADTLLKATEENDYLTRIANGIEGYTQEAFFEKRHTFGTLTFMTNVLDKTPEKIYSLYKSRSQVEQFFDIFKNLLEADRTYMQNEQACEAWLFINHLSMMLLSKLYRLLGEKDLLKKYSPQDLFMHLGLLQKIKIKGTWHTSEIPKETRIIMDSLGISIT